MRKIINIINFGFLLTLLTNCSNNSMTEQQLKSYLSNNEIEITDTFNFKNSVIYGVYQDYGAAGTSCYLFHKSKSKYYHFLEEDAKYTVGQIWGENILQTCSAGLQASDTGKWIIKTYKGNNISFDYEPEVSNLLSSNALQLSKEGIYRVEGNSLVWQGQLTKYCSMHDIDSGLYYLTPPAVFYKSKKEVSELEREYD
jgi:hypothetical protein